MTCGSAANVLPAELLAVATSNRRPASHVAVSPVSALYKPTLDASNYEAV